MQDPQTHQLTSDLAQIAQLVHEHDYKLTLHLANVGVMMFVTAFIAATQIDDSKLHLHESWRNMEFLHQVVYTLHDFLLKPIWSAKQLKSDSVIKIPADHRERLFTIAHRIFKAFIVRCRALAIRRGWSLNAMHVNANMMVECWREWQDASLLIIDLINELWLKQPYIGVLALIIQKQVYLQILLYVSFLRSARGSVSEAKVETAATPA